MARQRGLAVGKGILLVVSGLWMVTIAGLIRLFVDECRPSLPALPAIACYAGIVVWLAIVCVPIALAPTGPIALLRAALVSGCGSLVAAIGWGIDVFRRHHSLCEAIGHWAPGHHHRESPAGDVGSLMVYASSAIALVASGLVVAAGLIVGTIWRRRQRRAAASDSGRE
jgi:hypothetical protein